MASIELFAIIGVGAAVSALAYWAYFGKKEAHPEVEQEVFIPIKIDANRPAIIPEIFEKSRGFVKQEAKVFERKKITPLSGLCRHCKEKVSLPFRCKFCTELFCKEHRLPEAHNCAGM